MSNDNITYIEAKNKLFSVNFRELFRYRDLIWLFVKRDLVNSYKQTVLGPIWILINPLLSTTVFTVIFGVIAGISTDGVPPFLFYMSGNVLWSFFSSNLNKGSSTFLSNARIFGKVYFPRLVMPIANVIFNFINFALQTVVYIILVVVYALMGTGVHPNLMILLTPLLVLQTALLGMGIGLIVSSITTKYRDLNILVNFGISLLMYITPVVYPISEAPLGLGTVLLLNPVAPIVETYRYAFLGSGAFHWVYWLVSLGVTALILLFVMDKDCVIKTEHLTKRYTLGVIGSGTLRRDLQSWYAKKRGREDPNRRIGAREYEKGEIFTALENFDIEIKRGERVGIIGANGAGKSTFLKLLSRITSPTEGKIAYRGRIASMLEVGTGFSGELTGRENIYLNGAILGMTKAEVDAKIDEIISFSECETFIDTPVKRYSSGMFVKLAFAVAAHLDAEILIMDEVLAVGDMKFQKKCIAKMRELAIDENRTVLYVSHNMSTIQELCSRCVVLEHGRKVFDGEVDGAIKLYLGGENDELYSFEYVDDKYKEKVRRKLLNLTRAKFFGRTSSWFYDDEQVPLELDWTYLEDVERLGLRVEISDIRHYPITAFVIENAGGGKKGESQTLQLRLDISALAQGTYCVRYVFFTCANRDAKPESVEIAAGLTIRKRLRTEGDTRWQKSWGSVVSKGVEIVGNENN